MSNYQLKTHVVLGSICASLLMLGADGEGCGGEDNSWTGAGQDNQGGEGGEDGGDSGQGGHGGSAVSSGGTGGGEYSCKDLPEGPFEAKKVSGDLVGTHDIGFNSVGEFAAKKNTDIVLVNAKYSSTIVTNLPEVVRGLRFRTNKNLLAALWELNVVLDINTQDGSKTVVADSIFRPHGIFPDSNGNIWLTQLDKVSRINPDLTVEDLVTDSYAKGASGILFDADRSMIIYATFDGSVFQLGIPIQGIPGLLTHINETSLDGITIDECGNIYVIDIINSIMYRIRRDGKGVLIGAPEFITKFPEGVTSAQFGHEPYFSNTAIYAVSQSGALYAVPVGVSGAAPVALEF